MLKSRLNQQSFSFSSDDLNSRLRALTITLVQKQSSLERLTSEKSSLEAKYDQLQVSRVIRSPSFLIFLWLIRILFVYRKNTKKL